MERKKWLAPLRASAKAIAVSSPFSELSAGAKARTSQGNALQNRTRFALMASTVAGGVGRPEERAAGVECGATHNGPPRQPSTLPELQGVRP